jgi:predicted nucleic acid-binding protein
MPEQVPMTIGRSKIGARFRESEADTHTKSERLNPGRKGSARLAQKYGYERIGRARLTNDALIAASAARNGITVLTTNQRDFVRLAEFCPLQWQVQMVRGS